MSRAEYMRELDALLQRLSREEREEAMQYYNDYFDDAGIENEESVIEELGSPKKVAETIIADLTGESKENEGYKEYSETGYRDSRFDAQETPAVKSGYHYAENDGTKAMERMPKSGANIGRILLIICILVIGVPVVIPVAAAILLTVLGVLIAAAVTAVAVMFAGIAVAVAGVVVGICGFVQLFHSTILGIGMIGGGCLMVAAGAVLTVFIGWLCMKLIPLGCRGIVNLCRRPFHKKRGENVL